MHLLLAQAGAISDGSEPVDLAQEPADIVVISAADTELAGLAEARRAMPGTSLRLANLMHLAHPYTVDHYLERTATRSRLVVARVLGGESYWSYGLEAFSARLAEAGVPFAALPGDDKPDAVLRERSSVCGDDHAALWAYLVEGGATNHRNFLRYAEAMLSGAERPVAAQPLLRAGVYAPDLGVTDLETLRHRHWRAGRPVVAVTFYRALVQGAGLDPVDRLFRALDREGLNPLPVFVASLKDEVSVATLRHLFAEAAPALVLNATSFAVSTPQSGAEPNPPTPLDEPGAPVLQVTFSGSRREDWAANLNGLSARDIAMNVALPEIDGRIFTRAVSFKGEAYFDDDCQCPITRYEGDDNRIDFVAELARRWVDLGRTPPAERRVAMILANYPNKDGRLANGVGLDTPAAVLAAFADMRRAGYGVEGIPPDTKALMARILAGPTNWLVDRAEREGGERLPLALYRQAYGWLPEALRQRVETRWGGPEDDPFCDGDGFSLSIHRFGKVVLGVQPARGYNVDAKDTYHDPDLEPPHHYFAFYVWLREVFGAQAVVHMGKHGNMEWLPGKSVALSDACFSEATFGPMPHVYPFIVNDPGEGTQAKRRAHAVIVGHLTPPLVRAETYGPLKDLEALIDEYFQAASGDARRLKRLTEQILSLTATQQLEADIGIDPDADLQTKLKRIDTFLCDVKESQIRDGLHVFGRLPDKDLLDSLVVALARIPRRRGEAGDQSLIRALARDLGLADEAFDPLDCDFAAPWTGPRPEVLLGLSADLWRNAGDTVERLELLALDLVRGRAADPAWAATRLVLDEIGMHIRPAIEASARAESDGLLRALDGRHLAPGPSGAPTRGRLDVLPTGRNFYSLDSRTLPTPTAYNLGTQSAALLVERHLQDEGDWPRALTLTMWGTSNMRTGGDDIAQALALMGVKPTWDGASHRVTGFEILPLSVLDRPRVDVTVRISGFFRDAFPAQIDLMDSAARAVAGLSDEPADLNPAAARFQAERESLGDARAGARVFGSKPGAYGAGLQAQIDERIWERQDDLAEAYLEWGSYAYGNGAAGEGARDIFERRLTDSDGVVHNQDNREHDLLDSDDYYQFEGGLSAAITHLKGAAPKVYHNDHSRPERPVIRTLEEEISRVMRARVVNPKWIDGVMRHGYKGAFEIAATVDYLFAFAATTRAVKSHHFDLVYREFVEDRARADFIAEHNPAALAEIRQRLLEAIERGMWQPRSNSARAFLEQGGSHDR